MKWNFNIHHHPSICLLNITSFLLYNDISGHMLVCDAGPALWNEPLNPLFIEVKDPHFIEQQSPWMVASLLYHVPFSNYCHWPNLVFQCQGAEGGVVTWDNRGDSSLPAINEPYAGQAPHLPDNTPVQVESFIIHSHPLPFKSHERSFSFKS